MIEGAEYLKIVVDNYYDSFYNKSKLGLLNNLKSKKIDFDVFSSCVDYRTPFFNNRIVDKATYLNLTRGMYIDISKFLNSEISVGDAMSIFMKKSRIGFTERIGKYLLSNGFTRAGCDSSYFGSNKYNEHTFIIQAYTPNGSEGKEEILEIKTIDGFLFVYRII